jgi:hypothetical protein
MSGVIVIVSRADSGVELAVQLAQVLGWTEEPCCDGIFVTGSVAEGSDDNLSDVDLVLVVEPLPEPQRLNRYEDAGCTDVLVGFLTGRALAMPANITAIDKLRFRGRPFDICYCRPEEVHRYDHQANVVLRPGAATAELHGPEAVGERPRELLENRLTYALRIIAVHRNRYSKTCRRQDWLGIDLSLLLAAARDVLLVLDGQWRYNSTKRSLWEIALAAQGPNAALRPIIEDIRCLDDRTEHAKKLERLDELLDALRAACAARGILVDPVRPT